MIFSIDNQETQARVDVLPDGRVMWVAGGKDRGWVSLAGISYQSKQPMSKPPNPKVATLQKKIAATRKALADMEAELKKLTGK